LPLSLLRDLISPSPLLALPFALLLLLLLQSGETSNLMNGLYDDELIVDLGNIVDKLWTKCLSAGLSVWVFVV
jgi:hypothetical protein